MGSSTPLSLLFLQAVETISLEGLAALGILGSVEAYRLQQAVKSVREESAKG